jgi:hypothetical protein
MFFLSKSRMVNVCIIINQFGLGSELPGQALPISPCAPPPSLLGPTYTLASQRPSAASPPLAPPSRPTIPRRLAGRRLPRRSEEDGMEGSGEAHQALEDPPRRQRNLSLVLHPIPHFSYSC